MESLFVRSVTNHSASNKRSCGANRWRGWIKQACSLSHMYTTSFRSQFRSLNLSWTFFSHSVVSFGVLVQLGFGLCGWENWQAYWYLPSSKLAGARCGDPADIRSWSNTRVGDEQISGGSWESLLWRDSPYVNFRSAVGTNIHQEQ